MARYTNLDGTTPDKGLADVLRWQVERHLRPRRLDPPGYVVPRRANDGAVLRSLDASMTWIGHATFALRLGGRLVATDPIWSASIQPFIHRLAAPGVAFEEMPAIDVVTVSHAHYDHLDLPTLKRIGPRALYVVPRDVGPLLREAGLPNVVELGWWETHRVPCVGAHAGKELAITLVPAQHWSMRVPWDRNMRLWGGFVFEGPEGTAYHAGDTGFSEQVFRAIGERIPSIDWAMLPIGAYDPTWFMQAQHMGPEEAARAFALVGARNLCAMHWGTFRLTDEPTSEPPQRLRTFWREAKSDPQRLWIFDVGETRRLERAP